MWFASCLAVLGDAELFSRRACHCYHDDASHAPDVVSVPSAWVRAVRDVDDDGVLVCVFCGVAAQGADFAVWRHEAVFSGASVLSRHGFGRVHDGGSLHAPRPL